MLCYAILRYTALYCAALRYDTLCYTILLYTTPRHAMLRHAKLYMIYLLLARLAELVLDPTLNHVFLFILYTLYPARGAGARSNPKPRIPTLQWPSPEHVRGNRQRPQREGRDTPTLHHGVLRYSTVHHAIPHHAGLYYTALYYTLLLRITPSYWTLHATWS